MRGQFAFPPTDRMKVLHNSGGLCGILLLAMSLAGCATESIELLFSRPGSFDYLNCTEIAAATKSAATREADLKSLIDRAEKESFGVIVAAAAYRSDYLQAQGELKLLAEAAQSKKCTADTVSPKSDARPRP